MEPVLIVLGVIAALVVAASVWHLAQRSVRGGQQGNPASGFRKVRALRAYPSQGVLVGQDVLQVVTKSSEVTVWEALEQAAVPIAVQYRPVSEAEVTKFRTVPINASVQRSMVEIVKALNPAQSTLYTVVLPKGAELVKAVGISGFRGFARDSAGITAHAVLKPVAAGGAIAAGWPIFAVAGTVMAIDMAAQRELRAHQRKVEAILGRQEERHFRAITRYDRCPRVAVDNRSGGGTVLMYTDRP